MRGLDFGNEWELSRLFGGHTTSLVLTEVLICVLSLSTIQVGVITEREAYFLKLQLHRL